MNRILILLALIALGGACAQPLERRVATRLQDAGIPRPMAQCMARRWVDRLSLLQLRKIERLSTEISQRNRQQRLTVIGFVDEVQKLDDPEVVSVVAASAAVCALRI